MTKKKIEKHSFIVKVIITTGILRSLELGSVLGDTGLHKIWRKHVSD